MTNDAKKLGFRKDIGSRKQIEAHIEKPLKSLSQLKAKLGFGQPRILLAESNGFHLTLTIMEKQGDSIQLIATTQSRVIESRLAIAECLAHFTQQEIKVPSQAILVSANVIPALLELPLDKNVVIADAQMLEMVRWEMEPVFSQQIGLWTIGWILLGREYVTEQQRDEVLLEVKEQSAAAASRGGRAPSRFGETAIEKGFVTRQQLEECLALQEQLQVLDDQVVCGWTKTSLDATNEGGSSWLCSAMSTGIRQSWIEAFTTHDIRLESIYPQISSAMASLPTSDNPQVLIEIYQGHACCIQVQQGDVVKFNYIQQAEHPLALQDCLDLSYGILNPDCESIFYCGQHPRLNQFVAELSNALERPFLPLDEKEITPAAAGAARHYWKLIASGLAVSMHGREPLPPIYRNTKIQISAAVIAIVFCFIAIEVHFTNALSVLQDESDTLVNKLAILENSVDKKKSKQKSAISARADLTSILKSKSDVDQQIAQLNNALVLREGFMADFLDGVSSTVNDETVIDSIDEVDWKKFEIKGWAVNQESVQLFTRDFNTILTDWNIKMDDYQTQAANGRLDIKGYRFTLLLSEET
ncbi:MAG: hypothetical protein KUG82_18660 [Pseudomonadales bacterium]|nr:hypothetical protein [Pseudomonadales bacterium]